MSKRKSDHNDELFDLDIFKVIIVSVTMFIHEIFENLKGSIRKTQEKQSDFYECHTASYNIKVGNFMLPRISILRNRKSRYSLYSCLELYISAAGSPTEYSIIKLG